MRCVLRSLFGLSALVLISASALAVDPDEVLKDAGLEARARALSGELRCLVCQNQSIDDSSAPLAKDLRVIVRERLVAGDSDGDVLAFVVDRYGEFVLLRPRLSPATVLLWATPLVFLALAGVLLARLGRRTAAGVPAAATLTPEEEAHLAKILAGTDDRPRV